ncbi:MAG: hypothetical protein V4641_28250, partial [Pseudomonadota bacterium]
LETTLTASSSAAMSRSVIVGRREDTAYANVALSNNNDLLVAVGNRPSQVHARTHVDKNVDAVTTTTVIHTVTAGKTFYLTGIVLTAINASVSALGRVQLTDAGTVKIPIVIGQSIAGGSGTAAGISPNLAEPYSFTTNVRVDITLGTVTASCSVVGYEE